MFSEDSEGWANYVCGVVRGAAGRLPCLLQYLAETYPTLTVKAGVLARASDIETTTISRYYQQVGDTEQNTCNDRNTTSKHTGGITTCWDPACVDLYLILNYPL